METRNSSDPSPRTCGSSSTSRRRFFFPRCDLVISHGGSNTMLAALAHGIPQVMVPIGADQPYNAKRCSAVGVARVVPSSVATVASIREAARSVLGDPSYRRAARRIRDEMESLPGPDDLVMLLEELAREKVPLITPA